MAKDVPQLFTWSAATKSIRPPTVIAVKLIVAKLSLMLNPLLVRESACTTPTKVWPRATAVLASAAKTLSLALSAKPAEPETVS